MEYLWRVQLFGYMVKVFGAPVKGAIADHRGGDAYDEDARFGS
jgi:methanogenic corrinoid protein MtbC1